MSKPAQAELTSVELDNVLQRLRGGVFVAACEDGSHHIVATFPYIAVQGDTEKEASQIFIDALIDWFAERDAASGAERAYYDNLRIPFWERVKFKFLVWRDSIVSAPNHPHDEKWCQHGNYSAWHHQNAH